MPKFNPFRVRPEGNLEFWISNLVILVSTVLGVYLAAQAGFRTALEFEIARSEREGYYMRRALLDEVRDNLDTVDAWTKNFIENDGWRWQGDPNDYKLQDFVWETMKEQTVTFQLRPETLAAVRRYYDAVGANVKNMVSRTGAAGPAVQAMQADTAKMREAVLPLMQKDIDALRTRLASRGISVD
jgi:hypothetical protein